MIEEKIPKSIKPKLHKGIFVFSCACVLVLLTAFGLMIFRMVLNNELKDKLNKIRGAGYPATQKELDNDCQPILGSENSSELYKQALSFYHNCRDKNFIFSITAPRGDLVLGEPIAEDCLIASRQFVDGNSKCIALLRQVAKLPKFYLPYSYDNSWNAIELLATTAVLAANDGDREQAKEDILAMLNLCNCAYMDKFRLEILTVRTIEYTLSMVEFDNDSLKQITNALEARLNNDTTSIKRFLATARVNAMDTALEQYIRHVPYSAMRYQIMQLTGIATLNELKIIEIYKKASKLNYNNVKAIRHYADNLEKWRMKNLLYPLAENRSIDPVWICYLKLKRDAWLIATIIGLAIERYQLKYHKLPKKLIQLVPEFIKKLPNDPFTGKPFNYVTENIEISIAGFNKNNYPDSYSVKAACFSAYFIKRPGWVVYSFGRNLDDDKGIPMGVLATGYHNGDIPFRCVRKEK